MAYEKNNWQSGDVVTSAKLNHMEDGIANAVDVMVINIVGEDPAQSAKNLLRGGSIDEAFLDKTWQQIFDALSDGKLCTVKFTDEATVAMDFVSYAYLKDGSYKINAGREYSTNSADGYPKV